MPTIERWLPVVGFEGLYEVSNLGKVRSLPRQVRCNPRGMGNRVRVSPGKLLRPDNCGGYRRVVLCKKNVHYRRAVHTLVLMAFVGPCPEGMEGCHKNGIRNDNRVTNL